MTIERKDIFAAILAITSLIGGVYLIDTSPPETDMRANWQHIFYGNQYGGGHLYGAGRPCKSEFPKDWDQQRIKKVVRYIAANDHLAWREEDNGYYVAEEMINGLSIRVVLDHEKDDIITAYPTNVERNPCPANEP